ncbi:NIPA-like protein 2 isoform X1 [Herpailurus yagouaroundi]|uniref:NIPA-like protein 2 isoform X1 n=1 Tax=Herpailurus yagouaroundi TaxID=1608482 RepID=UPI001AD66393|nr:NIPA-like protein 2 isoform X1 [Puma yagouaroundi]XP_040350017.1 NIPA-like protein 2 isoform X1 [Puma yagouaroundi]XP_040350018.1 NIPA-like protein 2 isoform X1 [Puma yagouaroundi]
MNSTTDSPFWSFAGHSRKLGNQYFPKYSEIFSCPVGTPGTPKAILQEYVVVGWGRAHGRWGDGQLCSLRICPHYSHRSVRLCVCYSSTTGNDNFGSLSTSIQLELIEPGSTLNVSTCLKLDGSAIISVMFLKENLRASDLLGMTLGFAGTYLLVNFAPNRTQSISARTVQYYFVGWQFLIYVIFEILIFCTLLYFHKRKAMKHVVILLSLVALLASLTVISVKAVSGMITFSVTDKMQLTYPIFYIMFIIMIASCVFQVKFLNHATKLYNTAMVVPINHVFFTTSAIIAGIIFYQEFLGAAFLTIFIYIFGCFLSFLGVFLITRNRDKEHLPQSYIDFGNIPGKQTLDKIQPDSNGLSYGTLPDGSDSTKSQSGEKKEV